MSIQALLCSWKGHKLFARRQHGLLMGPGDEGRDACVQHLEERKQLVIKNSGLNSPSVHGGSCSSEGEEFAWVYDVFYCFSGYARPCCREILTLLFFVCIQLNKIRPIK